MEALREARFPTGRAWIELDRAALRHNVEALGTRLPAGCALMPAVKANAYGHGAVLVAKELNRAGIGAFCVATAAEGAQLRSNGVTGELLVLGYTHPTQVPLLKQCRLTQAVFENTYARELDSCGARLKVHIKIDTGMHRLGERWDRPQELAGLFRYRNLQVTGAFTHLCASSSAAPEDRAFTLAQARAFYGAVAGLRERGCACPKVHILSSYGVLNYPQLGGDYARVGIALYGALDSGRDRAGLRPVLSLKARVAQVRQLRRGEGAGYDLQFTAQRDTRLAVLAIGYADGLPRSLSCGVGAVVLKGRRAPIAGRICMDQTLVDVTDIPEVSPGDTAVLIGECEGEELAAWELAEQAGTIPNEILSRLGPRLERIMV